MRVTICGCSDQSADVIHHAADEIIEPDMKRTGTGQHAG